MDDKALTKRNAGRKFNKKLNGPHYIFLYCMILLLHQIALNKEVSWLLLLGHTQRINVKRARLSVGSATVIIRSMASSWERLLGPNRSIHVCTTCCIRNWRNTDISQNLLCLIKCPLKSHWGTGSFLITYMGKILHIHHFSCQSKTCAYKPWFFLKYQKKNWGSFFFQSRISSVQWCPTLQPHGLQHTRLLCPSPTPGVYSITITYYYNINDKYNSKLLCWCCWKCAINNSRKLICPNTINAMECL